MDVLNHPMQSEETVACLICDKRMGYINNRHLASHGMTAEQYRNRFPDAKMKSDAVTKRLSERSVASNALRKGKPRSEADLVAIREGVAKRESRKGVRRAPFSDEHRANLSRSLKATFENGRVHHRSGVVLDTNTKQKISKTLTGVKRGPEAALKALETKRARGQDLAFFRGRTHTAETKLKIGAKGRKTPEERAASREYMMGRINASGLELQNELSAPVFSLKCVSCNHAFTRTPQMFHTSKWSPEICDQCHPISPVSKAEDAMAALVAELIPAETIRRSAMDVIPPLELDIHLPDRNLAVEYCGLYWHSELAGKRRHYHRKKLDLCREKGVRLVTVFEDEWVNKPEIVRSMLGNMLGANNAKVAARKCVVEKLDAGTANAFIADNHIQGVGRSALKYGLIHQGEVLAVMTFSTSEVSRRSTGWDINRFCVRRGTTVQGAASKLFSAFVRDQDPDVVVSYADLRWGTGDVYGRLGFRHVGDTVPNYWYFRANEMRRYHRYGLRKKPDEPKDRTEWELRQEQGWNRIWDCGHAKWVWTKS